MKIVKKKVKDLKLAPYNPRIMSEEEKEKLKKSIETFGYVDPIIWNRRTGHVVGGNQRLMVLQEMGVEEVDVVEVDLSLDEEKALNVALNKISGEWDYLKLKELLQELDTDLLEYTGFNADELEFLFYDALQWEEQALKDHIDQNVDDVIVYKVRIPKEIAPSFEEYLNALGVVYSK